MSKTIRAVLFDLDDTLLENDMHRFVREYFGLLTPHMAHLVPPKEFVSALFHATSAMIQNADPALTNRQVFIDHFFPRVGRTAEEMMHLFDEFYAKPYGTLRSLTRPNPSARAAIQAALDTGCDVVIATNPIFPETAIRQRMEWADVSDFPFKLVTSYETMHSAKPNPNYYREIVGLIGRRPEECIMVGDDWGNDMAPAMKAGLQVYWVNNATESRKAVDTPARGTLVEFGKWFLGTGRE
ncbi:MAG: HAD family hydrolase [Syntrophaceae bacterium]|nr:HAD family hydrolase [Syntrophaceae bacterium]